MFKDTIKYKDNDGAIKEKTLYFHLSSDEILTLDRIIADCGMHEFITTAIDEKNIDDILKAMTAIILMAYCKPNEDLTHFDKSETIVKEFAYSIAYKAIIIKIATKPDFATEFMRGVTHH